MEAVKEAMSLAMMGRESGSEKLSRWWAALMAARMRRFFRAKSGSSERGASGARGLERAADVSGGLGPGRGRGRARARGLGPGLEGIWWRGGGGPVGRPLSRASEWKC